MSSTQKMQELAKNFIEKRNWIMLDCLNIWLHNESGGTARTNFPDLVLKGMIEDFHNNLKYDYSASEMEKAINDFQSMLKANGFDVLSTDFYSLKRDIIPQIANVMIERMLQKIVSEEQKKVLFLFAKYYCAVLNPAIAMLSADVDKFIKNFKTIYDITFIDDFELSNQPEELLRRLGLILRVDWVVSKRPYSSKENVVAMWSEDFLKRIDSYIQVSHPKIIDKINEYLELLNQKELISQIAFYDLLLEKDAYRRTPFLKSEIDIKNQIEVMFPNSFSSLSFRPGICGRVEDRIAISPLAENTLEKALRAIKRKRIEPIINKICDALAFFAEQDQSLSEIRLISDDPKVWTIDGLASSLCIIVMPWCKTTDVNYVINVSQKTSNTILFVRDQTLPTLEKLFEPNPKISFYLVNDNVTTYTAQSGDQFDSIINYIIKNSQEDAPDHRFYQENEKNSKPLTQMDDGGLTETQLLAILTKGENERVEFKQKEIVKDTVHLAKTITAIANTDGGLILIGVTDEGKLEKIQEDNTIVETIINISRDKIEPAVRPRVYLRKVQNALLYVLEIPRMEKGTPHSLKLHVGKMYYIRVGSTVRDPSTDELRKLFMR